MHRLQIRTLGVAALAAVASCRSTPEPDPRMVSEWMHSLYGAIRVERLSPPVASRLMGYATTAIYAGLASTDRSLPSLTEVLNGLPELPRADKPRAYDGQLVAIAAERVVLDSLLREALPTTRAALSKVADSLTAARAGGDDAARARADSLGGRIGLAIVGWSRADGFDSTRLLPLFVPPKGLGNWVNDAPATVYASQSESGVSEVVTLGNPANVQQSGNASDRSLILGRQKRATKTLPAVNMAGTSEPYWGQVRPFVLKSWNECPVDAPPPYSADTASILYHDADVVRTTRKTLTQEQRDIAFYWADNAGESATPVGHWISIASQMISERHLSAAEGARLMMLTAAAQADAFIASWGYKYEYSLIRPRAYIRRIIEGSWEPLIPTPPFPEYPSGHSTVSAASATVLNALVGDTIAFHDSTGISIGSAVRRFPSFTTAAEEAGISRIYGGIHFPYGNIGGRHLGACVGTKAIERLKLARAQ